jgi:hypothetical protein
MRWTRLAIVVVGFRIGRFRGRGNDKVAGNRTPRCTAQMDHHLGARVEPRKRLNRQFRGAIGPADILRRLVVVEPGGRSSVIRIDQHELGTLLDRDTPQRRAQAARVAGEPKFHRHAGARTDDDALRVALVRIGRPTKRACAGAAA